MDQNYLSRIELRRQIIADHHEIAIQASPAVKPSIDELYTWLLNTYLPTRFPTMFTLSPSRLLNQITGLSLPLESPLDPVQAFKVLGENLDEDILILLPSDDGDGYTLKGYVTCFPAGFNTKEKFEQKLRDIHKPVPGYKAKLEKSMDRFFEKIEVGKVVKRSNVSAFGGTGSEEIFADEYVNSGLSRPMIGCMLRVSTTISMTARRWCKKKWISTT